MYNLEKHLTKRFSNMQIISFLFLKEFPLNVDAIVNYTYTQGEVIFNVKSRNKDICKVKR